MEQIGYEHAGLDIISTEEFLLTEAMTGQLRNKTTGVVLFPPENRTNWDGVADMTPLKEYLRNVTLTPLDWEPESCMAAFPSDAGSQHFEELSDMFLEAKKTKQGMHQYMDNPVAVNATPVDRLREVVSGLNINRLCIYDQEMQDAHVVHFMCYHKMRVRMLTHFYAFLFFEVRPVLLLLPFSLLFGACIHHSLDDRIGDMIYGPSGSSVIIYATPMKYNVLRHVSWQHYVNDHGIEGIPMENMIPSTFVGAISSTKICY
jgi:hypothetical protein